MNTKALQRMARLLAALLVCALLFGALAENAATSEPLPGQGTFDTAPTLAPAQPLRSARIRAVGDLMMHKKQLEIARQAEGEYGFAPQYALIADSLADADYTLANLETTVGRYEDRAYSGYPLFNAPESLLEAIKGAGVDFLTLANNHMLDRCYGGMLRTIDLVEQYGFDFGGANRSAEERDTPVLVSVNGIRLGMLCYTQMTNGMEAYCDAEVKEFGINYLRDADFQAEVRRLRDAGADVVIAMPHWGQEYNRKPEADTVALAAQMVSAGVDVVLGSHPHMVQPVEMIEVEGDDGVVHRGLVAYSLGNFISNMRKRYTDSGIILEFTLRERQEGGFDVEDVGCVPIYCWKQADMIRAVSSLQYLDERPEGMDGGAWDRLRASYAELRELIDEEIPMIAE